MKISNLYGGSKFPVSFEIFPPKGEMNIDDLRSMLDGLAGTNPSFISVTCSAGGSGNSANTAELAGVINKEYLIPAAAHITCVNASLADIDRSAANIKSHGIDNVLALRGDLGDGMKTRDFNYASQLITYLRKTTDLCVGAGCYPEGHVECDNIDKDIEHLKEKQDAGAEFFISQLFFDNESFYRFIDKAHAKGVNVPIDAGIMPIMNKSQIMRMVFMCGASLPAEVVRIFYKYENDPEGLLKAGMDYAAYQMVDLAESGAPNGIHIYSMNKPDVARYEVKAIRDAGF